MAWLSINYKSEILHMPVLLDVLIPQGRGGYKTLYLLHGAGGDHASWLIKSRVADYVEGKNIAVIMMSGRNKCYVDNIYGKKYGEFISKELINKTESWFNVSTEKKDRYIAGMSMGGYGAFYNALNNNGTYNKAFSYSGLLDITERYDHPQGLNLDPVFGERENLFTGLYDLNEKIHKMSEKDTCFVDNSTEFYIYCGIQDKRLNMSKKMYETMMKYKMKVYYKESDGDHNWDYWDGCIKDTLEIINSDI